MTSSSALQASDRPLVERYDCAMLDLDGVVYRGAQVIADVPEVLRRVSAAGMTQAFVTNNAARPPQAVARQLRELGVAAEDSDVVTSAQAAARELAGRLPAGSRVLVVGGAGLTMALEERGLVPVTAVDESPVAVVQGFSPDVGWRQLAAASYLVAQGLPWVASNLDLTIPTSDGIAPGNGTLVAAVQTAVGHPPDVVAGKPYRPLFDETVLRTGAQHPIVVGDRLDTDIEGANRCGADSLLVMTGVTDLQALSRAQPACRPSYVAWTLDGLLTPHAVPTRHDGTWSLGGWAVRVRGGVVEIVEAEEDRSAGLRAVTMAAWEWIDQRRDATHSADLDISAAAKALAVP